MKKIVKIVLFCIQTILIFLIIGAVTTAITKNIYSDILVENFKSKAVFVESKSTNNTKIYEIYTNEERPTITMANDKVLPGNSLDILVSLTSEIEIPLIGETVSFFAGGHAALVLDEFEDNEDWANNRFVIETTGLMNGPNLSILSAKDYWSKSYPYKEIIGLRVDLDEIQRKKVMSTAISLLGDPYNYGFIVDTQNKSYCSDLIMKAYESVGVNLNKDSFTTSVYDLVVSGETYISYYHYFDNEGVKHIYYLV